MSFHIPAVLGHPLINTSSSLADATKSAFEGHPIYYHSHTIANQLPVVYGISNALPPLKARKVSEFETIFENPYSNLLCQYLQIIAKSMKEGNHD